jgi:hypothetical protein
MPFLLSSPLSILRLSSVNAFVYLLYQKNLHSSLHRERATKDWGLESTRKENTSYGVAEKEIRRTAANRQGPILVCSHTEIWSRSLGIASLVVHRTTATQGPSAVIILAA